MIRTTLAFVAFTVFLQWKPTCGGFLDCTPAMTNRSVWLSNISPSKNISSPTTFPSNESVFCLWRVNVPRGYRIKVHFNSFDVKNTSNCSQAAVEVAEIQGVFNTVLGRYCGEQPDDVVSTFSFVTVIYSVSKGSTQVHPGFHASLLLAPAETCNPYHDPEANNNIVLSGSSGTIYSPLFPTPYHVNMKCRWTITVPSGHRIKLSFRAFHLGEHEAEDCDKVDHVKVRDSYNENDPGYGTFCGNVAPSSIYSVGPKIEVTFVSDEERVFQGFSARFESISGGICTAGNGIVQLNLTHNSTGRLSSPDYPLQYPPVSACYWRLKAPDGHQVKLHFTTLNIEGDCKDNVNEGEWVRVDDYFTTDFYSVTWFWGKFCKGVQPPLIYSTRNELQVFFTSNYTSNRDYNGYKQADSSTNNGFYATFEVTPQDYTSRCRTDISPEEPIKVQGNTGSLVSPGYPNSYPIITCTWNIVVPDGYIVEMDVKDFEMDCAGNSELQVGKDRYCGSKKPSGLLTSESDLKIKMISKVAQNNRGFRATFSMTKKELNVASIVPWIVIPIVVLAICVTMVVTWRRRTAGGRDRRGSSFKSSIINRMRTQSTASQTSHC
ncbi:dorsal-ventral patterning tolloid-like protein 1 [Oculina patagonica]